MRPRPGSAAAGRPGMLVLACALAGLLAACAEGYPTEDEALPLRYGMGQAETLQAMNRIGQRRHLAHEWRYTLAPGCTLQVEARRLLSGRDRLAVPLLDSEAVVTRGRSATESDVWLHAAGGQRQAVLEGVDRLDATQMKWLLDHAARLCGAPTPTAS